MSLHPYLSYRDPRAALAWLTAMGGTILSVVDDADGGVQHAEVRLGETVVLVGPYDDDYEPARLRRRSVGSGLYLTVDDVDGAYERALDAGSRPVIVPEDTGWGGRRARVLDPGGFEWSFGDYVPGSSADSESAAIPSR